MLSNKEQKYRYKIIAENHLKKDGQRYLDQCVKQPLITYKKLYLSHSLLHSMLIRYSFNKLALAMQGIGMSCAEATNSLQMLSASLRPLGDYEKCKHLKR